MKTTRSKPTQAQLSKLWKTVEKWVDQYEVTCEESVYQVDSIQEQLPELVGKIGKIVGFAKLD